MFEEYHLYTETPWVLKRKRSVMWLEEDCDWKVQNRSLDLMKIEVWCAEKPEGIQMYFPHDGDMKS